jgi:hypothetical protein
MAKKYKFWFLRKQQHRRLILGEPRVFVTIGGKRRAYTEAIVTKFFGLFPLRPSGKWNDYQYLGIATNAEIEVER